MQAEGSDELDDREASKLLVPHRLRQSYLRTELVPSCRQTTWSQDRQVMTSTPRGWKRSNLYVEPPSWSRDAPTSDRHCLTRSTSMDRRNTDLEEASELGVALESLDLVQLQHSVEPSPNSNRSSERGAPARSHATS